MATTHLLTAEDLLEMPDDGHRYELVRGELREMPPSGHIHARIAGRVSSRLGHFAEANRLGEVYVADPGFLLGRDHVRAPMQRSSQPTESRTPGTVPASGLALPILRSRLSRCGTRTAMWLRKRSTG